MRIRANADRLKKDLFRGMMGVSHERDAHPRPNGFVLPACVAGGPAGAVAEEKCCRDCKAEAQDQQKSPVTGPRHDLTIEPAEMGEQNNKLVDLKGFEPLTSSMPWKRAPNCATGPLRANVLIITLDSCTTIREPSPEEPASYNKTMHRLRRSAPAAIALILALGSSSCSVTHLLMHPRTITRGRKPLPPGAPLPPLLNATREELNTRLVNLYNAINSFQATVQMTPSVGSVYQGKINDLVDVHAFVLFRKPNDIRIIGQAPVVRTSLFDMASTGDHFGVYIAHTNLFIEGSNSAPAASKNALENLRPEAFLSSMLIQPVNPATDQSFVEDDTDEENALYKLHMLRNGPDGKPMLARSVWFDRVDLSIVRQKVFNEKGEIISDTRYLKWTNYNGVMFPAHIDINRFLDGYGVTMDILEMQMNKALTDAQFALATPDGAIVRRIGETTGTR